MNNVSFGQHYTPAKRVIIENYLKGVGKPPVAEPSIESVFSRKSLPEVARDLNVMLDDAVNTASRDRGLKTIKTSTGVIIRNLLGTVTVGQGKRNQSLAELVKHASDKRQLSTTVPGVGSSNVKTVQALLNKTQNPAQPLQGTTFSTEQAQKLAESVANQLRQLL